jgi:hypothetical protein
MWIVGDAVSQDLMSQRFGCRILIFRYGNGFLAFMPTMDSGPYRPNIIVTTLAFGSRTAELARARSNMRLWRRIAHRGLPAN